MKRIRRLIPIAAVILVLLGLVYTFTLDTSTPVVIVEEDAPSVEVQEVLDAAPFHEISYTVGNTGLHFSLDDQGQWQWQDDVSFPLDDTWIVQLAEDLENLTYLRSIPLTEDNPIDNYGLEEPWGSVTAVRGDGSTLMLMLGNQGTDGTTCYALKDGDMDKALVYDNGWMETLSVPIYDMMELPTLPDLTADTVERVEVATTGVIMAFYPEDGGASWRLAGTEVSGVAPDLMTAITKLSLEKCFSYQASEQALVICGFDEGCTVTITYDDGSDDSASVAFVFGGAAKEAGYWYMTMGDESTIYLVAEEIASELLALLTHAEV